MADYYQKDEGSLGGGLGRSVHGSAANNSPAVTKERRSSTRHVFTATAEVYEPQSRVLVAGRCSDLSLGGCYVDTINPLPVDTLTTIRLQREARTFTSPAKVIYSKLGMGMGLAFEHTKPEGRRILLEWVRELSGETQPVPDNGEDVFGATPQGKVEVQARAVLTQLITTLTQKRVLSAEEGASLLESLFR
jgi:hypothetical protein